MTMKPNDRAGRRARGQGPLVLKAAPHPGPAAEPARDPWRQALIVLFIGVLLSALTLLLWLRSPDGQCTATMTAGCAIGGSNASPPVQQAASDAAHALGTLHGLGFALTCAFACYVSCATPWSAQMMKRGPDRRCTDLAWVGALLVGINLFVLIFHFGLMPLADWAWQAHGGLAVPYHDIPSTRDLRPDDVVGAAYRSGQGVGMLLAGAMAVAVMTVKRYRTGRR
ncbi:hypothetical protein [Massilia genomosp. 1]|uniref:Uncharacterized protein n=1 Tax=Massilia genomosp. 1 TaxID=2609280 RepID=A0ABX0MK80_9BURK|nr:hypothetical protein [Massilia genomosp. 1]NHZ63181.1 hypothetical protein [Massilia genomosp. 1]